MRKKENLGTKEPPPWSQGVAKTTPNDGLGLGVINKNNCLYCRDYVFTTPSKDIKTNWPFSLKNLQLCSKHGVKDVLPPF
jgi:hypothetical protein